MPAGASPPDPRSGSDAGASPPDARSGSEVPLALAVQQFLTGLRAGKPSPHTVSAYATDLRLIGALLAGADGRASQDPVPVAALTAPALRRAFAEYADTHSKASVARAWSTWNRLCAELVREGGLAVNPMDSVPRPRPPRSAPHAFTQSEMDDLVETVASGSIPARRPWPARDYAIIATLAVTGLRRAELLALTVDDVEGAPGARQVSVRHGKGDKYRAVPIDPVLEQVIDSYLRQRWARFPARGRARPDDPWSAPPRSPLWVSDAGAPMSVNQLSHVVQRAYRAAGINSRRSPGALVHALRHTFATSLVENGTNPVEIMALLGHASLQTTQRYLATRPDHLRDTVRANPTYARMRQAEQP